MVKLHKMGQNPHLYWLLTVGRFMLDIFSYSHHHSLLWPAGQSVKVSKYDPVAWPGPGKFVFILKPPSMLSPSLDPS